MTSQTPESKPRPFITLTYAQARVLALLVALLLVIAFLIGFKFMTVGEVAAQVAQGAMGVLVALWAGGQK